MSYDAKFIEELKEKNDIVSVVGKYCNLKRKGSVNYWACCPLPGHAEKTPSFTVNEPGQFFKCFGCGRGGDVITFVETMENLDYVGAVRFLADRAGVPLPEERKDREQVIKEKSERDRLLSVLRTTALFYVGNLSKPEAEKYREYLSSRDVSETAATKFGLGASLDMFSLPNYLKSKGFTEDEMIKSGVCKRKTGGKNGDYVYDFLSGRLIFPIINNMGNVIAFGGRTLEKNPAFMKYKNTEETSLFKKNRALYNVNRLKEERAKKELSEVILVEGYMGTIRPYINGYRNVVASMGTSLTVEQARMLRRYAPTVIICYDGDSAGQKSTLRGLDILAAENLEVKVVTLPPPDDPDDFIRKYGGEAFGKLLAESLPLVEYKMKLIEKEYDPKKESEKLKYTREALKIISDVPSESEKEQLLKKLGAKTNTTFESLKRDLDRLGSEVRDKPSEISNADEITEITDTVGVAERFILCAKLFGKSYARDFDLYSIKFRNDVRVKTRDMIAEYEKEKKEIFPANLSALFEENELAEYNAILAAGDPVFGNSGEEKYFNDCVAKVKKREYTEEIQRLNALAAQETDTEIRKKILKAITEITIKSTRN